MFLIFGLRTTAKRLGPVSMICPVCRQLGGMLLVREVTKLSLFFIPLLPIRTRHVAQCTNPMCGARVAMTGGEAHRLLADVGSPR
jgi:hypothetical protein